jgi:hypothetical protein
MFKKTNHPGGIAQRRSVRRIFAQLLANRGNRLVYRGKQLVLPDELRTAR